MVTRLFGWLQSARRLGTSVIVGKSYVLQTCMIDVRLNTAKHETAIRDLLGARRDGLTPQMKVFLLDTFQKSIVSQIQDLVVLINSGMNANQVKAELMATIVNRRMKEIDDCVEEFKAKVEEQYALKDNISDNAGAGEVEDKVEVNFVYTIDWKKVTANNQKEAEKFCKNSLKSGWVVLPKETT